MDIIAIKNAAREIQDYEDWKDSPERYEWSVSTKKDQCCPFLHSKNEPCRQLEPPCCIYWHVQGTPCPVDKAASAATAE